MMKNTQITQQYIPLSELSYNEQIIRNKIEHPTVEAALNLTKLRNYTNEVQEIVNEPDEAKQKLLKEKLLTMINYYGYFYQSWDKEENKYKLKIDKSKIPTGILVIDFDKNKKTTTWEQFFNENDKLDELILNSGFAKYVTFMFKSPRNGWKIGIKTDLRTHDASEYKEKYITLIEVFQMLLKGAGFKFKYSEVDYRCQDIMRRHFASDDPDIYINYNAVDFPLTKIRKREDSRSQKRKAKKAKSKATSSIKEVKEVDEQYNRDVDNKLYNYLIIKEVLEYTKKNTKFEQAFVEELNIASRNNDEFNKLMCCLQSAIDFNDAENVFKTILSMAGVFNPQIFKKKWYKVDSPETNINYLIVAAQKAGFRFDKKDYELIHRVEQYAPKIKVKENKIHNTVEKFITDELSDIVRFINKHEFVQIVAPTSSGKTELICKHLPEQLNSIVMLSVPYIALADGIKHTYKEKVEVFHSKNKKRPNDYPINNNKVWCSTFDTTPSFEAIIDDEMKEESLLVIDELHQILSAYNFRGDKIRDLIKFASGFKKIIGLTGTQLPASIMQLSPFLKKFKTIRFTNRDEKEHVVNFNYSKDIEQSIINNIKKNRHSGKKWAIYMNHKEGNILISKELNGIELKTMIVNADTDNEQVEQLKKTGMIPDDVDVLIVTSAMRDGFNIKNKDVAGIFFYKMQPVSDIVQFSSRFREVKGLQIWIHSSSTSSYHLNNCYSPKLIADEYAESAMVVAESLNNVLLPMIHDRGVLPEITKDAFYDNLDYAIKYYSNINVKLAIGTNKDDFTTAYMDEEGLAYYALKKHNESECANPIFFISELLNYGYKIGKVITPKVSTKKSKKKNLDEAKRVTMARLKKCLNEKECDDLLVNIQNMDSISEKGICYIEEVNQQIELIGERALELKTLGYTSKTALEETFKFDTDSTLFNNFKRQIQFGIDRRNGNVQKYKNFLQYEKDGIKKGIEIATTDWKNFIKKSKSKIGDKSNDLPKTELSKYYQIEENKKRRTIKIIGLKEPVVLPEKIPYDIDFKKYG